MQNYDIYLFDWDGTLADSTSVWIAAARRQFDERDLHPTDAEIIVSLGDWQNMLSLGVTKEELPGFRLAARAEAMQNLPDAPLFSGADAVLRRLKTAGKRLAVVTAMHREIIDHMLAHHSYQDFFDVVISGSDVQQLKPHPEGLLLALEKIGHDKGDRVLMLGDTTRDILAAHEAGVDSLLYYPAQHEPFHDLEALKASKPTFVIHNWDAFGAEEQTAVQ